MSATSLPDDEQAKLVKLLRSVVHEELTPLRKDFAEHQREESEHHKRVNEALQTFEKTVELLIVDKREQAQRLTALEARVARLEESK